METFSHTQAAEWAHCCVTVGRGRGGWGGKTMQQADTEWESSQRTEGQPWHPPGSSSWFWSSRFSSPADTSTQVNEFVFDFKLFYMCLNSVLLFVTQCSCNLVRDRKLWQDFCTFTTSHFKVPYILTLFITLKLSPKELLLSETPLHHQGTLKLPNKLMIECF